MTGIPLHVIADQYQRAWSTLRAAIRRGVVPHTRDQNGHIHIDHKDVPTLVAATPRRGTGGIRPVQAAPTPSDLEWRLAGSCTNPDTWPLLDQAHPNQHTLRAVRALCSACPVVGTCRTWGIDNREPWGVWGGLTVADRDRHHASQAKPDTKADAA